MNRILISLLFLTVLGGCKKEEEVTVDFEIYTNVSIDGYRIAYISNDKQIMRNTAPISRQYNPSMLPGYTYAYPDMRRAYSGSVTAEKGSMVCITFPEAGANLNAVAKVKEQVNPLINVPERNRREIWLKVE